MAPRRSTRIRGAAVPAAAAAATPTKKPATEKKPAAKKKNLVTNTAISACTYLELSDSASNKFWEITVDGASTTVRYGKIGANGTSQHKVHDDDDAADVFAEKQIAAKVKKGYSNVQQKPVSVDEAIVSGSSGNKSVLSLPISSTHLEMYEDNIFKFWDISVDGACTIVRHGVIGAGLSADKDDHDTNEAAVEFAETQVAAKRKEGYVKSVQLSGRQVPDLLVFCRDTDSVNSQPLVKIDRDLVEIPPDIDHLLIAVGLNRTVEIKAFLAESGNSISGSRLLSALYTSMMCGHDSIANEISKYLAANVNREDTNIEPVLYLCWTLLCVGWCFGTFDSNLCLSANDMKPAGLTKQKKKTNLKFKLQNFDEMHDDKKRYEQEVASFGLDSDADYDENEEFFEVKHGGYDYYDRTIVDTRHLHPIEVGGYGDPLSGKPSFNMVIRASDVGCNEFEDFFIQARLWKRVVDEEFGENAQRLPTNEIYTAWHEWWLSECATRPSNESRTVLMGEGPAGCSVQTLLRIVDSLPPSTRSAAIKLRIADKAWAAYEHMSDKSCVSVKQVMAKPHWKIGNPSEYSRLVRDLMKSQSSNWVTGSRDIRATIVVMAGLDVFVRPTTDELASETYNQRVGVLAGLTNWPGKSPLELCDDDAPKKPHWPRTEDEKALQIKSGLVFVSDCDPKSFDMTDIPPTGLLPMHTLIAYRVKSEFGDLSKSGAMEDNYQTCSGRPFMVNATSPSDLAAGRTHVQLTASDDLTPTSVHVSEGWNEWPAQQLADVSLDETITQSVGVRRCQELHAKWMHNALDEHASVAAFSKFILELMTIGAPRHLLEWAHRASVQEIDHTRLCVMMASAFAGVVNAAEVGSHLSCEIGCLPDFNLSVSGSIGDIAASTLLEGAMGETQAALQLAIRLDASLGASQGRLCGVLMQLMHDETSHGALAWATLQWMVVNRNEDGEVTHAIETTIATISHKYASSCRVQVPLMFGSLVSDGFVRDDVAMSLEALCFWEVIAPLAGMIVNIDDEEGGWELEAGKLRQLAPTNLGAVLDEMVVAIRS